MAGLPQQFPDLAVHLADETGTTILSSADAAVDDNDDEHDDNDNDDNDNDNENDSTDELDHHHPPLAHPPPPRSRRQNRAAALGTLTTTALRARDTAAHLGLGIEAQGLSASSVPGMTPPAHVVVTYNTGTVLIESFMDPHALQQQRRLLQQHRSASSNGQPYSPQQLMQLPASPPARRGSASMDLYEEDRDVTGGAPLLVGLVVAPPGPQPLRDARRATSRLERVGHALQREWAAEET